MPQLLATFSGLVPKFLSFANPRSFNTLICKVKKQIQSCRIDKEVKDRLENCPEFVVHVASDKFGTDGPRRYDAVWFRYGILLH